MHYIKKGARNLRSFGSTFLNPHKFSKRSTLHTPFVKHKRPRSSYLVVGGYVSTSGKLSPFLLDWVVAFPFVLLQLLLRWPKDFVGAIR